MASQQQASVSNLSTAGEQISCFCFSLKTCRFWQGVKSEKELVKAENAKYARLFVTDHCRPRDSQVDAFVSLVQKYVSAKQNVWIHIHCKQESCGSYVF
jgi:hypothetical protein